MKKIFIIPLIGFLVSSVSYGMVLPIPVYHNPYSTLYDEANSLFQEERFPEVIQKLTGTGDRQNLSDETIYLLALSYINLGKLSDAELALNTIVNNTQNQTMLNKAIYKLEQLNKSYQIARELDNISDDLIPYSEVIENYWEEKLKKQYIEALDAFKVWDYKKAEERAYWLKYVYDKNYKLLYNIAYMSYKADIQRQSKNILGEIYQNASEKYKEKNSELMRKVDVLYKRIEDNEKHQEEEKEKKKAENERKKQEEVRLQWLLKKEAELGKSALGAKASIIESLVPVIKSKDSETQQKVSLILETFKASSDEYTRSVGFYLSYLLG